MTPDLRSISFPVSDPSQVGEARRAALNLSAQIGLDENTAGKIGILVTELANNLQKHASEGVILFRRLDTLEPAIEILAVDKGPGMIDVEKCFRDGYSSIGTPGTGLGSVARMADKWDVYSVPGKGTALMAQKGLKTGVNNSSQLDLGAVTQPIKGETKCGDNWGHIWNRSRERIIVADGLGHGEQAAEASNEAENVFREKEGYPLPEVMQAIHNSLRKTRGAAVALAELDFENRMIRFVGIGNISAAIDHEGKTRSLVSQNGTVGHELRKIQEFQYPWPKGSILVMNSDGLLSKWELSRYPGLLMRHPALITALLWRDFPRGRDDILVLAVREKGSL
jgi:anti-sigma regulatory factor (Ser/Thr protein kinase)